MPIERENHVGLSSSVMNKGAFARIGRPKSEEKREAILEAASALFLAGGLQGTSMDAVALKAGVSKQTVYSHFASKEDLFRTCISTKVESYGFLEATLPADGDLGEALRAIGRRYLELILDDEVAAMFRIVIGESVSYRKIAELFYASGPDTAISAVAGFLASQMQEGRLKRDDPRYAACLYLNMLRGHYHLQRLMNIPLDLDEATREAHIRKVAGQFLTLYGTETSPEAR